MSRVEDPTPERPARPPMSDDTAAPMIATVQITGTAGVSRTLWRVSLLLGLLGILFALVFREGALAQVGDVILEVRDTLLEDEVTTIATTLYFVSLGVLGAFLIVDALLVRLLATGRGGARWGLIPAVMLHGLAAAVIIPFIASGRDEALAAALLWSQLVLALAALVVGFLPDANRWFRRQHELRRNA